MKSLRIHSVALLLVLSSGLFGCDQTPLSIDRVAPDAHSPRISAQPLDRQRNAYSTTVKKTPIDSAFFGRRGAIWGPGVPGWTRVASVGKTESWQPSESTDGRLASWLKGVGGRVVFPIGDEGPSLRHLSIWLYPSVRKQAVSIFLDGQALTTIRLKSGWNRYDFALPKHGLKPGEHRLRFWFRTLRYKGHLKTPGALAAFSVSPDLQAIEIKPERLDGSWLWPEVKHRLPAGAPSRWTTGTVGAETTRFKAQVVAHTTSTTFILEISEDKKGTTEAARVRVEAGGSAEMDVPMAAYAGRLVRVHLKTEGADVDVDSAHWIRPRWEHSQPQLQSLASVRNVIVWTIEGLWSNGPSFGRNIRAPVTPNLDLVAQSGTVLLDTWSGGHTARGAQAQILDFTNNAQWVGALRAKKVTTGLFTLGRSYPEKVVHEFDTHQGMDGEMGVETFSQLLEAIDHWLEVRKYKPFMAYVDTGTPGAPGRNAFDPYAPYEKTQAQDNRSTDDNPSWRRYRAHLSFNDYWVGALLALLRKHDRQKDTAIIIVGLPSRRMNPFANDALNPERLQVPLLIWGPGLQFTQRMLRVGAHLNDVGPTVLDTLGLGQSEFGLLAQILSSRPAPIRSFTAQTAFGPVVRYGDWTWWPQSQTSSRLWVFGPSGHQTVDYESLPIVVRTLKDRLISRSLKRNANAYP